ncbi:MAG: NAD-dependent epimerase/dehydratase family protein [Bryobacteraceae bacterium]
MEDRIAIIGAAGAVGRALADECERRGVRPVVTGRDSAKLESLFAGRAEIRAADLNDAGRAARALEGVVHAVYCVGLPYPQFHQHPVLMRKAIDAARRAGVRRMAVVSSVYSYGRPQTARVSETHPREPESRKGRFRREQEDAAIEAHSPGEFETCVLHLPDFYGPYASNSLAHMMMKSLMAGKPARWLGDPDLPHEFVFMPDAARVIADMLDRPACFGRRWNLAGAGEISGRRFAGLAARQFGTQPRVIATGRMMLRLGGLFSPLLRELVELQYLGEVPVLLDDTALRAVLGEVSKTPYEEGVRRMAEWMRGVVRS